MVEHKKRQEKGMSYSAIGRKYNIDRRTAKKYCESNVKPDYKYTSPKKRKIDAYPSDSQREKHGNN